jgi:porphobilinogen synthase
MEIRPRRNRKSETIRAMVRETEVSLTSLMYPLFVVDGKGMSVPIQSMPGIARLSEDLLLKEIEESLALGIYSFVLFPAVSDTLKDPFASYGLQEDNFYLRTARAIKERFPEACLMSDVAMDPYSSDGHDGLVVGDSVANDETLPILAAMAVVQARAGFDIIGPSDMMDGRVASIREALDNNGFTETSIMSYTAKYASAYYGPFRDALDSTPKKGDKKTYQMDPANKHEALRELELDEQEGADFVMVKPALCYLDVIHLLRQYARVPVAAYNVSGEYAMIKAASANGWLQHDRAVSEMLTSICRAGADVVLTYFAKEFAQMNKDGRI